MDSARLDALFTQVDRMADRLDVLCASRHDDAWNESDHPRAEDGKFGSGGGKQRSGARGKGGSTHGAKNEDVVCPSFVLYGRSNSG